MDGKLKEDLELLLSQITTDAQMALDDTWDRSDDGFVAMQENVYDFAYKYKLNVKTTERE